MGCWTTGNTCNDVFADSAYRSAKIRSNAQGQWLQQSEVHRRGRRNHPLSLAQVRVNHATSRIRARIEHVFGAQQNAPGRSDRANDWHRAGARLVGLQNLAYNISPPGDAGTARRGMRRRWSRLQCSNLKQWAEKEARKTIENRT